jgi:hypothetical protein
LSDTHRPIRIALFGLNEMMAGIVSLLATDIPGAEVIRRDDGSGSLHADFDAAEADVIVCAVPTHEMDRRWHAALAERPALAVFNLMDDHTHGRLYALVPDQRDLADVDATSLVRALRAHVTRFRDWTAQASS